MMEFTADRVPITEGLVCYDNNLDVVVVGEPAHVERNENTGKSVTWYRVYQYINNDGLHTVRGRSMGTFDGGRLSTTFRNYHGKTFRAPTPIN